MVHVGAKKFLLGMHADARTVAIISKAKSLVWDLRIFRIEKPIDTFLRMTFRNKHKLVSVVT